MELHILEEYFLTTRRPLFHHSSIWMNNTLAALVKLCPTGYHFYPKFDETEQFYIFWDRLVSVQIHSLFLLVVLSVANCLFILWYQKHDISAAAGTTVICC
jgi:hypothetical protein